jgi:transposase
MNGVLWVLRTGAPWHELPSRYPPYQTCHRRFQLWQRSGRLDRLLQRLVEDLRDRGKIDLSEAFVDATFASAKKGALKSVQRAAVRHRDDRGESSGPREDARTAGRCDARSAAGKSNGSLPGSTTAAA